MAPRPNATVEARQAREELSGPRGQLEDLTPQWPPDGQVLSDIRWQLPFCKL